MIDIANHAVDQWRHRVDGSLSFTDTRGAIQCLWETTQMYYEAGERVVHRAQYHHQWVYLVVQDDTIVTVMTDAEARQHGSASLANQGHAQQRVQQQQHRTARRTQTHSLRRTR